MIRIRGPIGHFLVTPDTGCVPLTVSINGSVFSTVSIIADLGDGTTYNDTIDLVHTYNQVGNYYPVYTLTDSLGCTVAYPIDTIVVGLIPYPGLPPDTSVCQGNYVPFNLPLGDYFQWTSNLNQTYLTCDTCKNTLSNSPDTIIYYVTASTTIGCIAKDTITVNVDPLPTLFPGGDIRICPHDTIQMHAGTNAATANWKPDLFISDTSSIDPLIWTPDTVQYRVTVANELGCSLSRTINVWPITRVLADLSVSDTSLCQGGTLPLQISVIQASTKDTSILWTPAKYLNADNIADPIMSGAPTGNYVYTVIVSSSTCIADTGIVKITLSPNPDLEAGKNQTVAVGTTVQLYGASHEDVTYTWTPTIDSVSCNDCRITTMDVTQSQIVYVTATNPYGCHITDSVELKVVGCDSKMVFVPNTFTPNGDGRNDKLFVRGIGLKALEYFKVFDRWGVMVFETQDISEGWDGQINGKPGDMATYVYVLKGICTSGSIVEASGNVTLMR